MHHGDESDNHVEARDRRYSCLTFNIFNCMRLNVLKQSPIILLLGFSLSENTWLPVNDSYKIGINVEDEERDEKSTLNNYKDLVKIRRNYSDLIAHGSTNILEKVPNNPNTIVQTF